MKIAQALREAVTTLSDGVEMAVLEAEMMLAHTLQKDRTHLRAWPDKELSESEWLAFTQLISRRRKGEPVAHLLGKREFWSLDLFVNEHTLIPRPETELLVEEALTLIPDDKPVTIADLGTGSGAIALAVASERPLASIHASDVSEEALAVARRNVAALQLNNISLYHGDWFAPLATELRFDFVLSNPPYIAEHDEHLTQGDVRYEPRGALTPGGDGLSAIRAIAAEAVHFLLPNGWLLFEHGYDQGEAVVGILSQWGFDSVQTIRDLAGCDRVTLGQWKSSLD